MKKHIFTCFLALLCLAGSPPVLSQVVQSPGADFLHRSGPTVSPHSGDTNRGGETLSDTFLEYNDREEDQKSIPATSDTESLGSCILCLTSSNSLVDQHLDPGAGEETLRLQPAPVTVFAHPTTVIPHPTLLYPDSLKIGDSLPPGLEVGPVLHHPDEKIRLDDYRGKYLLLMFWSPTCSGSIGTLPRIDQLAKQYQDRLEVVPITIFPEERVMEVSQAYPSFQKLSLPVVTGASYLRALFPHTRVPHAVIVDPEGKIAAITGPEDITAENLDLLFATGAAKFRLKVDRKIRLNAGEKLISENTHLDNKNIWLQSALTGYIPDVGGSLIQNYEGFSHIRITNMTLIYLFQLAYSERDLVDYFGVNRIETLGFDPEELTTEKSGADVRAWMEEGNHVFGYELIAPPSYDPFQLMREDLKRYFPHIQATVETQTRKVKVLVQQEGRKYSQSASDQRSYKATALGVSMTRYPLQGFVYHLNAEFWRGSPTPIVNQTGIDYPIDLRLEAPLGNYEKLREALQQNGLDLIEREEEIKILVLKKISPFKTLTL